MSVVIQPVKQEVYGTVILPPLIVPATTFQISAEQNIQALEVEALRLQQRIETESGGQKDREELTLAMKHLEGQVTIRSPVQIPAK